MLTALRRRLTLLRRQAHLMYLNRQATVTSTQVILNSMPQAILPQKTVKQTYGLQTLLRIISGSRHVCLIKMRIFSEKAVL